jgi:acyl carrier protein
VAHHRRGMGLAALSINWGPWSQIGMAAGLDHRQHEQWAAQGLEMIEPDQGILILERFIRQERPQLVVIPVNWQKFLSQFPMGGEPPILAEIAQRWKGPTEKDRISDDHDDFLSRLDEAYPEDRHELLFDHLCGQVRAVLKLGPSVELRDDQGLTALGMDSLMAVELTNRLKRSLKHSLPSTIAFERPTIAALFNYLSNEVLQLVNEQFHSSKRDQEFEARMGHNNELEGLSESELEMRLAAELERSGY